jgi:hypothetical protein
MPRYGRLTSNIVESHNFAWKQLRSYPPLLMLGGIWVYAMEKFAERRDKAMPTDICYHVRHLFEKRQIISRRYRVHRSDTLIVEVVNEEGKSRVVDLEAKNCTCGLFREYQGPCSHAIKAARVTGTGPFSLFSHKYHLTSYRLCYQPVMKPLLMNDLAKDDIEPPLVLAKRGRPLLKRIRNRTALQDRRNKCSNSWCRQRGHNKRRCTTVQTVLESGSENENISSRESELSKNFGSFLFEFQTYLSSRFVYEMDCV